MDTNYLYNLYDWEMNIVGKWYSILAFCIICGVFFFAILTNGYTTLIPAYLVLFYT